MKSRAREIAEARATAAPGKFHPLLLSPTGNPVGMPATVALVMAPVAGGHDGVHMGLNDPLPIVALNRVYRPSDRRALLHQLAVQKAFTEPAPVLRSHVQRDFHHDMPRRHGGGIARRDGDSIRLGPDPVRIARRPERRAVRQQQSRTLKFEPPLGETGRHGTEPVDRVAVAPDISDVGDRRLIGRGASEILPLLADGANIEVRPFNPGYVAGTDHQIPARVTKLILGDEHRSLLKRQRRPLWAALAGVVTTRKGLG